MMRRKRMRPNVIPLPASRESLRQKQLDLEAHAALAEEVFRSGAPAVRFGDESNDVEAETQVLFAPPGCRPMRDQRLEERSLGSLRQQGSLVRDGKHGAPSLQLEADLDRLLGKPEVQGVLHQLVQRLGNGIGHAEHLDA